MTCAVTSPTIRKRILKRKTWGAAPARNSSYIAYDPQEDTETSRAPDGTRSFRCYIAYDPQEDTETAPGCCPGAGSRVTSPTIRKRILKHRPVARSPGAVGRYIAYDPQEDTETAWADESVPSVVTVTSPTIRKRILKPSRTIRRAIRLF